MGFVIKRRARYRFDSTSIELEFPVLITEHGVLVSLLRYFYENRSKSQSWFERASFSIRLLLEYLDATCQHENALSSLRNFVSILNLGSEGREIEKETLFWKPRSPRNAASILEHINLYTDWLAEHHCLAPINSFRKATVTEERLKWSAYCNKKAKVFLNHLGPIRPISFGMSRKVRSDPLPTIAPDHVNKFPESEIRTLLNVGFRSSELQIKNVLITILLHYGGLRVSEPFHIYASDILYDDRNNEAIVRVHHPEYGLAPDNSGRTRAQYLAEDFGLVPRNKLPKSKRLHAGWKSPLLTNGKALYFEVFFTNGMGATFFELWIEYLKRQRCAPSDKAPHPYAFTNSSGSPATVKNFQSAYRAAAIKIGLSPSKETGCSPHGHRHSYGYRLSRYGFSNVEIQKAMHHKSPDSCLIYTQPSNQDIREKLRKTE